MISNDSIDAEVKERNAHSAMYLVLAARMMGGVAVLICGIMIAVGLWRICVAAFG